VSHPGNCRLPAGRPAALARPARSETSPSGRSVLAHFWNSYACTTCSGTSPSSAAARLPRRGGAAHRGAPSRKDPANSDADPAGCRAGRRGAPAKGGARRRPRPGGVLGRPSDPQSADTGGPEMWRAARRLPPNSLSGRRGTRRKERVSESLNL